jgi:TonB-dependent receptor-like protein
MGSAHQVSFRLAATSVLTAALAIPLLAQRERGELRLEVRDAQGAALAAHGELVCRSDQFTRSLQIGPDGKYAARDLPFGVYRLTLNAPGFAPWAKVVEIRSEVPVRVSATLGIAPVTTQVQVSDEVTLVDSAQAGTVFSVGQQSVEESIPAQPGRSLSDLVNDQPGWLYEANGILHPRGSEYDVQYVFDGLPLTQNRSPAFAPALDADEVESMRVLTASFPAEYGRKLGGIIEVSTLKDVPVGWHGRLDAAGGSFSSASGSASVSYSQRNNHISLGSYGFHTDRYLDPPVLDNFTNRGTTAGLSASYEHNFTDHDRLRVSLVHSEVRFLVPNERLQQEAGQRQDIADTETTGQVYFQHTFSQDSLLSLSGSVRDANAGLRSNSLATPVIVSQDRGYREGYVRIDFAGHASHHDWKAGADGVFAPVHERLLYAITDPSQFPDGTLLKFAFPMHRTWDVESSAYIQDHIHLGNWNFAAGLRFDHYDFVIRESAWSPRIAISRYIPSIGLLLHCSYDRVFQTPAVENLLLASSPDLDVVNSSVLRLPVRPGQANYYEVGLTKAFAGKLRLDANVFRRDFHNYPDDDVLLDTGVSFPIAFAKGRIFGEEVRVAVPHWGAFSGYLSYANQSAVGYGPVTGGLFLGDEASSALTDTNKFASSQDQRNTLRAQVRCQATRKFWIALASAFGSGLPVQLDSSAIDFNFLRSQFGPAILGQVNFAKGRVRPNVSLDASAGAELYRKEHRSASLQVTVGNLADRVNVINFESLFSGTAVAAPRSVSAGLHLTF